VGTRFSAPVQTGPGAHPASCKTGTGSFSAVKCGRGVLLTTHPPSSAAIMEQYSYTSTLPLGHTGPVKGSLYLSRRGVLAKAISGFVGKRVGAHILKHCPKISLVNDALQVAKCGHVTNILQADLHTPYLLVDNS